MFGPINSLPTGFGLSFAKGNLYNLRVQKRLVVLSTSTNGAGEAFNLKERKLKVRKGPV